MYTKLDYCLTVPMPRQATRAAATGLAGLPDELIGDIPSPAPGPAPAMWNPQAAGAKRRVFPRQPRAGVRRAGRGGVLLLCLFVSLVGCYLGLAG